MFRKYKKIMEKGVSNALCEVLDNIVFVYGGSNFPDKLPPEGSRKVYNDIYVYDKEFNFLSKQKGNIYVDGGIKIKNKNMLWYIFGNGIYKIHEKNLKVVEEKVFDLDFEILSGFGCISNNKLIFGYDKVYEYDILKNSLKVLSEVIFTPRNQSVYVKHKDYLYLFGGATNVSLLDSYRYSLVENKWEKLNDIPTSFLGSSFCEYDQDNLIIMGGFNKEVFDNAVINLSNIEFKINYFKIPREDFKWNQNIYLYNFEKQEFKILAKEFESATCGSSLIKINDSFYLVNGEEKPGFRSPNVFEYK